MGICVEAAIRRETRRAWSESLGVRMGKESRRLPGRRAVVRKREGRMGGGEGKGGAPCFSALVIFLRERMAMTFTTCRAGMAAKSFNCVFPLVEFP